MSATRSMLKAWWLQSLENGPTPLRFLRSKTHALGKACLAEGIRREYTPGAWAAQHRYMLAMPVAFALHLPLAPSLCGGAEQPRADEQQSSRFGDRRSRRFVRDT
jgi:hypothetical protein